jgi:hypothetical protein
VDGVDGVDGANGSYTQKAYTTEALMIADAENIPANSSVDVTNDETISKNGTYAYDGTTFTKAIDASIEQTENYTDAGKLAQATLANDGTILHGVKSNGDVISPYPPLQGFGLDTLRSQMLDSDGLNRLGRYYDRVTAQNLTAKNFEVLVVAHASDGLAHNRGGGTFYLGDGRFYTTFAQFTQAGDDQTGARLAARFVDVDFETQTATVSPTVVVHDGRAAGESPPAPPSFFRVKDGILMVGNRNKELFCHISTDECQTWTERYRRTYADYNDSFFITLSSVTQIPAGTFAGRIVATGFGHSDTPTLKPYRLKSMYSDDDGRTWQDGYSLLGSEIGYSDVMNETGVTVDTNNDLIIVIRDELNSSINAPDPVMRFARSKDGGRTLQPFEQTKETFADACQTSLKNVAPNAWDGVPKVVSVAPFGANRKGLRLRISYDNAKSWAKEYDLFPNTMTTGYTSVIQVNPSLLCVTTEYGGFNAVSNIALRFINLKEIYNDVTI